MQPRDVNGRPLGEAVHQRRDWAAAAISCSQVHIFGGFKVFRGEMALRNTFWKVTLTKSVDLFFFFGHSENLRTDKQSKSNHVSTHYIGKRAFLCLKVLLNVLKVTDLLLWLEVEPVELNWTQTVLFVFFTFVHLYLFVETKEWTVRTTPFCSSV